MINDLEPTARGPYCGAIGVVDADAVTAKLAVGIRTFWLTGDQGKVLHFGTGAGITWGSDPEAEWEESELKARHLTSVAAGVWTTNPPATVWINGELIPADRATVSVYDRGFTSGDGV